MELAVGRRTEVLVTCGVRFGHRRIPGASLAGAIAVALLYSGSSRADTTNCKSDNGTVAYSQCIAGVLADTQKQLDQALQKAIGNLPKLALSDVGGDARKTTEQLRQNLVRAQSAWQTYANESCAFVGAMQGRNLWVGIFQNECLIREMRARINALEHLPGPP